VPLEKEVLRLGGKLPSGEEITFKLRFFKPLDPFLDGKKKKIVEYWANPSSEYSQLIFILYLRHILFSKFRY